jgi:hypothetical protein
VDGERFYPDALAHCQNLARAYSLPVETVAGVVAALSPNNKWSRNLQDAHNICRAYVVGGYADAEQIKCSTYNRNKIKALTILGGADPSTVLGGLKVRAFYGCIMGDPYADVCVDGHAYSVWLGQYVPTTKTPKISPKLYAAISADYAMAAEQINIILNTAYLPCQIQAITWLAWRRIAKEN